MPTDRGPRPSTAFWRAVFRFDANKLQPVLALRNSLGVAIPLAVGVLTGSVSSGLVAATGALNVSFSDGHDPYLQRGRRMLLASALVAFAVFVGAATGGHRGLAAVVISASAFAAGMLVAIGPAAADLGGVTLVTMIVFAGQPMHPARAFFAALLAFAGAVLQTAAGPRILADPAI